MQTIVKIEGKDYRRYTKWISKKKAQKVRLIIKAYYFITGRVEVKENPRVKGKWAVVMRLSRR